MERIITQLTELNLHLNINKTQVILFKKGRAPSHKYITLQNSNISIQPTIKFLGLYLDCNMSWNSHFESLYNKLLKRTRIFRYIAGRAWGMHPKCLLILYNNLIRSYWNMEVLL